MPKITRIKAGEGDLSDAKTKDEAEEVVTRKKVVVQDRKTEKDKRKKRKEDEKKVLGDLDKLEKKGAKGSKGSKVADSKVADSKELKGRKNSGEAKAKKPFILIRPIVYFFRYLRDSWKELRQVRWPNRKATWGMAFAVLVYTAAFMILISLLDLFFKWLFGMILGS